MLSDCSSSSFLILDSLWTNFLQERRVWGLTERKINFWTEERMFNFTRHRTKSQEARSGSCHSPNFECAAFLTWRCVEMWQRNFKKSRCRKTEWRLVSQKFSEAWNDFQLHLLVAAVSSKPPTQNAWVATSHELRCLECYASKSGKRNVPANCLFAWKSPIRATFFAPTNPEQPQGRSYRCQVTTPCPFVEALAGVEAASGPVPKLCLGASSGTTGKHAP